MKNIPEILEPQIEPKGSRETRLRASLVQGFAVALAAGLFFSAATSANAEIVTWKGASADGGNGAWITPGNWTAFPSTSGTALFVRDVTYTSGSSTVTVSGSTDLLGVQVGANKTVKFDFEKDSVISMAGVSGQLQTGRIVVGETTGSNSSHATFSGPLTGGTAHLKFSYLQVGGGSTLTFTQNLSGTLAGVNNGRNNIIGGSSSGNNVSVTAGARIFISYQTLLSQNTSTSGNTPSTAQNNSIVVSGSGSLLEIGNGFLLASGTSAPAPESTALSAYTASRAGSFVRVEDGGTFRAQAIRIGNGNLTRSNYIYVTGSNSVLSANNSSPVIIGHSEGFGGNHITVDNGGLFEKTNASASLTINGFSVNDEGGTAYNDGQNRLTVGAGGTFRFASRTTNYGLMQLAATGTINGAGSIDVESGGRFEVAGSGLLVTTGTTIIKDGGTLAVGLTPTSGSGSASVMTVASKVRLETGSTLEFGLFGTNLADRLDISNTGVFTVDSGISIALTLEGYTPVGGETWTLLVNNSGSATRFTSTSIANFEAADFGVLPTLAPHLSWDMSAFNEAGGWQVSIAIPEPSSIVLLGFGLAGGGLLLRKRKRE